MYLDTVVILALLKADDWLQTAAPEATYDDSKTSIITAVEIQLVMFESWSRSDLVGVCESIEDEGVEVIPLTIEVFEAGAELLSTSPAVNVFDAIHVGHAITIDEPLVSTDTRYPGIEEIDHLDPREL